MKQISNILQVLNFSFLRDIDQYLLENYPVVWRTGVHYFIFYSTILGNVLIAGLAWAYPVSIKSFPDFADYAPIANYIRLVLLIPIAYWILIQFRRSMKGVSERGQLLTFVINTFCLLSLLFNSVVFSYPLIYKTAGLLTDERLEEYEYFKRQNFWICPPWRPEQDRELGKKKAEKMLREFGVPLSEEGLSFQNYREMNSPRGSCDYRSLCYKVDGEYKIIPLKEKFQVLATARKFHFFNWTNHLNYHPDLGILILFYIGFSFILTLTLITNRNIKMILFQSRRGSNEIKNSIFFNKLSWLYPPKKTILLLENRPLVWATPFWWNLKFPLIILAGVILISKITFILYFFSTAVEIFSDGDCFWPFSIHCRDYFKPDLITFLMKNTEDIVLFFLLLILPFLAIIINRKWCIRQSKFYLPALSFKEHALVSKRFVSFVYLHAIITVLFLIVQRIFFNVYFPYVEREEYHTFNGDLGMILYTKLTFFYVILFSGILTVSWVYLTKYVKQIQVATVFFFSILATIMIAISFFNKDIFNSDAINPTIFIVVRQLYMIPVLYFGTYLLVFLGDKTNRIIRWLAVVLVANSMLIYVWLICALSILLFNSIPIDILLIGAAPVELNEFKLFLFVLLSSSLCYPLFIYLNWPPMKTIMDWHSTPKKK